MELVCDVACIVLTFKFLVIGTRLALLEFGRECPDFGFGYDPVFFYEPAGKSFAELSADEKNLYSHRGKTFRKLLQFMRAT